MKKFVCSKIRFTEERNVTSVTGQSVVFAVGSAWTAVNFLDAALTEDLSKSSAGTLITQTLQVIGEISTETANRFKLPLIFELTLSDGRVMVWGNKSIRVKARAANVAIGNASMSFERLTTKFEF
jgi:hypothetical protein